MAELTAEEKLEIKRLRKIALADQQIADHRAKIDEINVARIAIGLLPIGSQSA